MPAIITTGFFGQLYFLYKIENMIHSFPCCFRAESWQKQMKKVPDEKFIKYTGSKRKFQRKNP
jgi:hypothetical protein